MNKKKTTRNDLTKQSNCDSFSPLLSVHDLLVMSGREGCRYDLRRFIRSTPFHSLINWLFIYKRSVIFNRRVRKRIFLSAFSNCQLPCFDSCAGSRPTFTYVNHYRTNYKKCLYFVLKIVFGRCFDGKRFTIAKKRPKIIFSEIYSRLETTQTFV